MFNFQGPLHPCPSTSKILPPLWPWMSSFKRNSLPPLPKDYYYMLSRKLLRSYSSTSMITNDTSSNRRLVRISVMVSSLSSLRQNHRLPHGEWGLGPSLQSFNLLFLLVLFVFNVNALILSGFHLTSFHLAEASKKTQKKPKSRHMQIDHTFYCLI